MNFQDLCCFIKKLKVKQSILEKNESDFMKLIKENYGVDVDADFNSLKLAREQELHVLKKDIRENTELMNTLKQMLVPENIGTIDLIPLKDTMLALENSIITAKSRINNELDNLVELENNLTIDITNIEMKYADSNKSASELNRIKSITKPYIENQNLYQEVNDFATFVAETGGHDGGWPHNDHLIFIRNYNKIKNIKKLTNAVHSILPDISEERIISHIHWYTIYLCLKEQQKEAIKNWRKAKITRFKINLESNNNPDNETKKINKSKTKTDEQRQQTKEKIEKWKQEKEKNTNKLIKQNALSIKSNNTAKHKVTPEKIKKEISKWKTLKQSKLRIKKIETEINDNERNTPMGNKLIKEFQNQDNKFIERRMNTLKLRKNSRFQIYASKDLSKNRIRNPERVFRATKQWISRISGDENKETCFENTSLFVKHIPKLATPAWKLIEQTVS